MATEIPGHGGLDRRGESGLEREPGEDRIKMKQRRPAGRPAKGKRKETRKTERTGRAAGGRECRIGVGGPMKRSHWMYKVAVVFD